MDDQYVERVQELIAAARNYLACTKKVKTELFPGTSFYGSQELVEMYKAVKADCGAERNSFLNAFESFTDEEIAETIAIMYVGREKPTPADMKKISLETEAAAWRRTDREILISQMMQKSPLPEYLENGLRLFELI